MNPPTLATKEPLGDPCIRTNSFVVCLPSPTVLLREIRHGHTYIAVWKLRAFPFYSPIPIFSRRLCFLIGEAHAPNAIVSIYSAVDLAMQDTFCLSTYACLEIFCWNSTEDIAKTHPSLCVTSRKEEGSLSILSILVLLHSLPLRWSFAPPFKKGETEKERRKTDSWLSSGGVCVVWVILIVGARSF
jgi:hypothetical protein